MNEEPREPEKEEKPAEDTQPTQPGERLRRLVASAQDGDTSVLSGATGPLKMPAAPQPQEGKTSPDAKQSGFRADEEQPAPPEESAAAERHPTGEPEEKLQPDEG